MKSTEGDYRVLHGVRVRVHPEEHPRKFVGEAVRWRCVVDNIEAAQRCLTGGERRLYYALAELKAQALSQQVYYERLGGGPGVDGEGERLPF